TKNANQIKQMDEKYQAEYGISLERAIYDSPSLLQSTKSAVSFYLKGNNNLTKDDYLSLSQIAIDAKAIGMFEEIWKDAPADARKDFSNSGQEEQLKNAFGPHWYSSDYEKLRQTDLQHAKDYVRFGKISIAQQARDNTGALDNEQSIESALKGMTK